MEHYYSAEQKSDLKIKKIRQKIKGNEFGFYTASGVFSKGKIDRGTLVLAENMRIKNNSKILDVGCGIGILGIAAAKFFDAAVVMTDINKRAVMLAEKNVELHNAKAEIHQGNLYEKIKCNDFDVVISNPPQTAGKELCFQLIGQSKNHLKQGGNLQIVARHNKGGKTLSKKMEEVFGNVKVIAKKAGYWVYLSEKG
ncbi:class I SAM-dependent methyltransferase [Candidatus Woesearchaeota archaeon]|nr:class I SAM-dependent methyltransferase [Candidatus Woesearchaeota archaeon]